MLDQNKLLIIAKNCGITQKHLSEICGINYNSFKQKSIGTNGRSFNDDEKKDIAKALFLVKDLLGNGIMEMFPMSSEKEIKEYLGLN